MNNFDIYIQIKDPTSRQLANESYMIDYRQLVKDTGLFRETSLRILDEHFDFSLLTENEVLIVRFRRNYRHKIDYSSIRNKILRARIRLIFAKYLPTTC